MVKKIGGIGVEGNRKYIKNMKACGVDEENIVKDSLGIIYRQLTLFPRDKDEDREEVNVIYRFSRQKIYINITRSNKIANIINVLLILTFYKNKFYTVFIGNLLLQC